MDNGGLLDNKMSNRDLSYWALDYFWDKKKLDYSKCINRSRIILKILHQQQDLDKYWISSIYSAMAKSYWRLNNYEKSIKYAQMSIIYAHTAYQIFDAKETMARCYELMPGHTMMVADCYKECVAICHQTQDERSLARIFINKGKWEKNESLMLEALYIYQKLDRTDMFDEVYHGLCLVYIEQKSKLKVIEYLAKINTLKYQKEIQYKLQQLKKLDIPYLQIVG